MVAITVFVAVSITDTVSFEGSSIVPAFVTYTRTLQFGGTGKNGLLQQQRQQ
ncbi:hypothetical protein ACMGD3_09885 [Lysinibacillus sphaericus]|uniref:hypothetical protein n=1 Tax=Lysinibacillus sphaericus TaxID=1421 RepID=UPI003F7A5429